MRRCLKMSLIFFDESDGEASLANTGAERGVSQEEDATPSVKLNSAEFAAFRRQRRGDAH